nr:MAG TPA: hypothetical protein [Caudoviricetes sp.]
MRCDGRYCHSVHPYRVYGQGYGGTSGNGIARVRPSERKSRRNRRR